MQWRFFPSLCILRWTKGSCSSLFLVWSTRSTVVAPCPFRTKQFGRPLRDCRPREFARCDVYATVVEVAEILRSPQACKLCTTAHALADRRSSRSAMWRLRPSWMQRRAPSQEPSKRFGVWDPHENPGHRPNDRNPVTSQSEVESGKHLRCRWRK